MRIASDEPGVGSRVVEHTTQTIDTGKTDCRRSLGRD